MPLVGTFVLACDMGALSIAAVVSDAGSAGWVLAAFALALLRVGGRRALDPHATDDMPVVASRLTISAGLVFAIGTAVLGAPSTIATGLMWMSVVAIPSVIVARWLAYSALRASRERGVGVAPTLIVGHGQVASELESILATRRRYGLLPVGIFDPSGAGSTGDIAERLAAVIADLRVERVIVAFGPEGDDALVDALRMCRRDGLRVHVVPRFFEIHAPSLAIDDLRGIPMVAFSGPGIFGPMRTTKRLFDVSVATIGLIVSAPVIAIAAVAVRFSSPGPVLFRQLRVGVDGRPFEILKFRTMRLSEDSDTVWHLHGDRRTTRVGRILRRTSIDELPQLLNVLRGDMSIVGPRPERPHYARQFDASIPGYAHRVRVRPGITGWAQVNGRERDIDAITERARLDNAYIERWSIWTDIAIVFRTVGAVLTTRG